ncbi:MAG: hypothetical protein ABSD67_02460 [Terracidiphilus sp.]|jgi:hypothetical protein
MDKPMTPGGPVGSKPPGPDNSGSNQDFGATGAFGTVMVPETGRELSNSAPEPGLLDRLTAEAPKQQPVPQPQAPTPVAEPVVHKVVFGGGAAASSPELLDRMRMASAERAATPEVAPESSSKGSGGFTELLRTLGNESPASAVKEPLKSEPPRPAADSGFTSLLRTLGTLEPAAPQVARTVPPAPPSSSAPSSGGFTELLRAAPIASSAVEPPRMSVADAPVPATPAPTENQPGAFTQLFGTFGGAGATSSAPPPEVRSTTAPPPATAGSFTQMLSLEQQSAPVQPVYREERRPATASLDYGLPPSTENPAQGSRSPFALAPPPPVESTAPSSGVGITRLIQMLDQPSMQSSTQPVSRQEPVPVSPPRGAEPGIWTQTFASLATPSEPAAPPAYPVSREPQYPAFVNPPVSSPSPTVPAASGPSEFTRILDASRMRELAMRGGAGAQNPTPPPPPQSSPPAPQFAPQSVPPLMSHFPIPPQPAGMLGMGGMPQQGGFPPPPAYPMQFGAQPGAMPTAPGSMPHQPGMFTPPPPPPLPPVQQAPPVKPPELAAAKTQQLLVIMGVVIIVLLIAILVTVIFLMKH